MNHKISVIVPVYNTEKYLKRCLHALKNQTYQNLEFILVDDGSTDQSGKICDWYAGIDSRFRVVHKENAGAAAARNDGISMATGDYIGFADSDDYICADMYEYLLNLLLKNHADAAQCALARVRNGKSREKRVKEKITILDGEAILIDYLNTGEYAVWNKLYNKEAVCCSDFTEGMINEDIAGGFRILRRCRRLVKSSKIKYYYVLNHNSVTLRAFNKKDMDLLRAGRELAAETGAYGNRQLRRLADMTSKRFYFTLLARIAYFGIDEKSGMNKDRLIRALQKEVRKNWKQLMLFPMPVNRKAVMLLMCMQYDFAEWLIHILKQRLEAGSGWTG